MEITETKETVPNIFPDYIAVTIPPTIAPLNFRLEPLNENEQIALLEFKDYNFKVKAEKGEFRIPLSKWKKLLGLAKGDEISITVYVNEKDKWTAYLPFTIRVATEPIDSYLAYRLIEPGYEAWNEMGIYQRNLENFTQKPILENKMVGGDCMNCHSFCMQNPDQMMMHIRGVNAATMIVLDGKIEKLNTKTPRTISTLVYPSWHPSGKYIAFSVNDTKQDFHSIDKNRVEVYDNASDVVVYDLEKHELLSAPSLFSEHRFETFPTFSPDGRTLFFSTAEAVEMPMEYEQVKYSLCSIGFDPVTRAFASTVDTIFNARIENQSASFPRVSPDGKFLLYTKGHYGGFFIWHKEADLYLCNLETKEHYPLTLANSDDAESYHSWSSNSRWIVYSSRRLDGLYTRLFIAYVNEHGIAEKAFLLPQKELDFYDDLMKSYNVPEFITGEVKVGGYELAGKVKSNDAISVEFK